MKRIVFVLACAIFSLEASFYKNQNITNIQSILAAFDIDSSYQMNAVFAEHFERTTNDWDDLLNSFENSYAYIPILKQMLSDAEVPQEFLYLAMAESRFKSSAHSKKKASGIWQIVPKTAKKLGLKIDDFIDERRDPIKSTQAAIKYLKELKEITGKWYLAAMAYNCGIGRLNKAIREAGSDDIDILMDPEKKYIPLETRNYIRQILAMNVAFGDIGALKIQNKEYFLNRGATTTLAPVKVRGGTSLESISKGAGISLEVLRGYNRQFKYGFVPPVDKEFDVYLPYESLLAFRQNFKPQKANLSNFRIVHLVKPGDTLSSISHKYNISISSIKNANNMTRSLIKVNQKLIIPLKGNYQLASNSLK